MHKPHNPDELAKPHTQHKNIWNPGYLDHPEILKLIPKIGRTWQNKTLLLHKKIPLTQWPRNGPPIQKEMARKEHCR